MPDIRVSFKNGRPYIYLKVFLQGELQALQSYTEYENTELKPVMEESVTAYIKKELDKTIFKCRDLNCDAFGFGDKACVGFLTIQDWEAYHWLSHFKEAEITTEVNFSILRTGIMIKTNPAKTSEEENQ